MKKNRNLSQVNINELASAFDNNGFELTMDKRVPYNLSIEESIVATLLQNEEPRLQEGVPVLLVKNRINYETLRKLIDQYKIWNEFGYFGNFALKYLHNKGLENLVRYCRKERKPEVDMSDGFYNFFKELQSKEEKNWGLIGGIPYKHLDKQFRRYSRAA